LIIPGNYCLVEIEVPDDKITTVKVEQLPEDWRDISGPVILREFGDAFLKKQEYLLMKVPSSIVPAEYNYLLNPLHPDAFDVKLLKREPFGFDRRLL
jgi:RES domain-containing protein